MRLDYSQYRLRLPRLRLRRMANPRPDVNPGADHLETTDEWQLPIDVRLWPEFVRHYSRRLRQSDVHLRAPRKRRLRLRLRRLRLRLRHFPANRRPDDPCCLPGELLWHTLLVRRSTHVLRPGVHLRGPRRRSFRLRLRRLRLHWPANRHPDALRAAVYLARTDCELYTLPGDVQWRDYLRLVDPPK